MSIENTSNDLDTFLITARFKMLAPYGARFPKIVVFKKTLHPNPKNILEKEAEKMGGTLKDYGDSYISGGGKVVLPKGKVLAELTIGVVDTLFLLS